VRDLWINLTTCELSSEQSDKEGEVVFTTAMTGYQEICTDPSYHGQMVVLTYPLVGNYGINENAIESRKPWLSALIVSDLCEEYNHWNATESLISYLIRHNIVGMADVNTRALTRHLRTYGTKRGFIRVYGDEKQPDEEKLIRLSKSVKSVFVQDVVEEVSLSSISSWPYSLCSGQVNTVAESVPLSIRAARRKVIIIDTGFKENIARCLTSFNLEVLLVPFKTSFHDLLALRPDGILLPNGPGDPVTLRALIEVTQRLIPSGIPLMGICLGHQII